MRYEMRAKLFLLFLTTLMFLPVGAQAQERYDSIEVGPVVYEDVEILRKTDTDLFIRHSRGACNLKVADLDNPLRSKLGYDRVVEEPASNSSLDQLNLPPEMAGLNAQVEEELKAFVEGIAPAFIIGFSAVSFFFYIFFCFCCSQICKKAGTEPSVLIWIPLLQMFPLFRAARMSGWSVLLMFAPQLLLGVGVFAFPQELAVAGAGQPPVVLIAALIVAMVLPMIISIVWCVKICIARGKSGWLAILFFLPLTNLFLFLYLAFSGTDEEDEAAMISFNA